MTIDGEMCTILREGERVVLDHVVIVVAGLDEAVERLSLCFGTSGVVEGGADLGYRRAVFELGGAEARVEVCQPIDLGEPGGESQASTAFRKRLERSGSGLYSLAVSVPDVGFARDAARAAGARVIESEHSDSFFLHPRSTCGVLLQVLEAVR